MGCGQRACAWRVEDGAEALDCQELCMAIVGGAVCSDGHGECSKAVDDAVRSGKRWDRQRGVLEGDGVRHYDC